MKIVLGFDDSPHALAALRWITRQKWPTQPQVTVVSAVRTPITAYAEVYAPSVPYPAELLEEMTRHHEELSMRAEDELRQAGFPTTVKVLPADPREALVDTVRAEHADLLVVGSHGRTGLSKLLLGSVAAHVVAHAPCDVLVVKTLG
ncbi:MAG TPA: universal stress protein [Candidatus Eisenbacteria bacterium]